MGLLKKATGALFGDPTKGFDKGIASQNEMYQQARGDLAPYREFGGNYLAELKNMGRFNAPTMEQVQQTPGYKFRMDQGREAIENSAIARGGLLSGNTARALEEYGQNFATNEYNNAYGRSQGEYQNELARLMGFANMGYGASGGSANLAMSNGNQLSQLYANRGQAEAEMMQFPWKLAATAYGASQGGGKGGG